MPTGLWRFLALAGALVALGFVVVETAEIRVLTDDHIVTEPADGHSYAQLRLVGVSGTAPENGGLRRDDVIAPLDTLSVRAYLGGEPAGTTHRWMVRRGTRLFATSTTVTATTVNEVVLYEILNVVRLAMILVALVVALRRPEVPAARALVTFLILIAVTLTPGGAWLPDPGLVAWRVLRSPLQIFSLSQGLLYACIFPFASTRGLRATIRRINPWYTLAFACAAFALSAAIRITNRVPDVGRLVAIIEWSPLPYFVAIAVAFWIAALGASGRDRQRVYWAAGSICVGFSGPVAATILQFSFGRDDDWLGLLALTLVAIPFGLAYTILRHRTIDIGFVISRALVLTILSALIVVAFGLLERALGKLFIDASHVASRSVELALALGLGFSLRNLHARIERIVDRLFFRRRQRSLAALKTFANDVYFITDPDVAIERTVNVVNECADATNTAVYLIADGVFGCAEAVDARTFPAEVSENDPLFVRMRASRQGELARDAASGLAVEIAFPMFVRATLVGALVLTEKRTGEAYDPEECALLTELAQRVGLALDALQTLAMRRELEALISGRQSSA